MLLLLNFKNTIILIDNSFIINNKRLIEYGNLINYSWSEFIKNDINLKVINNFITTLSSENKKWIYKTSRMSVNDIIKYVQSPLIN